MLLQSTPAQPSEFPDFQTRVSKQASYAMSSRALFEEAKGKRIKQKGKAREHKRNK